MPMVIGIVGMTGRTSQPQPGGKPSSHQLMPASGSISNQGFATFTFSQSSFKRSLILATPALIIAHLPARLHQSKHGVNSVFLGEAHARWQSYCELVKGDTNG